MKTIERKPYTVNGKVYKLGTSSYWSDHTALFVSFDGGKTFSNEFNTWREYGAIVDYGHIEGLKACLEGRSL